MCRITNVCSTTFGQEAEGISAAKAIACYSDLLEPKLLTYVLDGCFDYWISHVRSVSAEKCLRIKGDVVWRGIAAENIRRNGRESSASEAVS